MSNKERSRKQRRRETTGFTLSRRAVITGLGAGGVLLAAGLYAAEQNRAQNGPFENWRNYVNKDFPPEKVVAMGVEIQKMTDLPGFPEAGAAMVDSQIHPEKLKKILPIIQPLVPSGPLIPYGLSDTVRQYGALGMFDSQMHGTGRNVVAKNKVTGEEIKSVLAVPDKLNFRILLDNSFYAAPDLAKQLILVKEASHILYIPGQIDLIVNEITANHDVTVEEGNDLRTILFVNANSYPHAQGISAFSDHYQNASLDLDAAGYWHIMRSYGKLKSQGKWSPDALHILSSDDRVFEESRRLGYLVEKSRGEFEFRGDIKPFTKEWRELVRKNM